MYRRWVQITQRKFASPPAVVSLWPPSSDHAFADNYSPNSTTYATPKTRPIVRSHPLDNLGVLNDDFPLEHSHRNDGIV